MSEAKQKKLSGKKGVYSVSIPIEMLEWLKQKSKETGVTQTRLSTNALKAMYEADGMPCD